jgi:hypothetical protein
MLISNCIGIVELLDFPDEILLIIMQKVGHPLEFFYSLANIGNERLQYLAFDKCSSIDLTADFDWLTRWMLISRFFSRVLPHIHKRIHSFTINIRQVGYVNAFAKGMHNEILPNLTQLKIMRDLRLPATGTPVTIGNSFIVQSDKSIENSIGSSPGTSFPPYLDSEFLCHVILMYIFASRMFQRQSVAACTFIFVCSGTFFRQRGVQSTTAGFPSIFANHGFTHVV